MLKTTIEKLMREAHTRHSDTLNRNIQIVQTYFGLGSQSFPTFESVAEEFGLGSRERIRQIVTNNFVNKINQDHFSVIHKISQLVERNEVIFIDEFIQQLIDSEVIDEELNIRGLLNLLHTFNLCKDYELYNLDINKATKTEIEDKENILLVKVEKEEELRSDMRKLRALPGRHGMVNLHEVFSINNFTYNDFLFYQSLIMQTKTSWVYETDEKNLWYMFEDRDNVMVNALEKIVNVTNHVNINILSEIIHTYISKRTFRKVIPSVYLIKQYMMNSKYVKLTNGDYARINVEKSPLLDIENDILHFYKSRKTFTLRYPVINSYLEEKGYSKPHRDKALYHSPIIFVDKTNGRGNYELQLITLFQAKPQTPTEENSYEKYKKLLKALEGKTDITQYAKARKEQFLLRDWLFKNKNTETCAICGRTFSISSLVAAHKKKRATCTEGERTDPNIVMPVCLFGCDYLYEDDYIYVHSGKICIQNTNELQKAERDYLVALENQIVDKRWLKGSDTYFIK
ncbi:hypothetical protein ACFFHM_01705 [Halalkalibacter kiskunsagensis]|uniref:C2H2-type domain-containing protein n=1 Tax=Halalkalibacter kiskunsagensis TaxID=1548599 RepID=A0ABV6K8L2_9BACI